MVRGIKKYPTKHRYYHNIFMLDITICAHQLTQQIYHLSTCSTQYIITGNMT